MSPEEYKKNIADLEQQVAESEANLLRMVKQSYKLGMLIEATALLNTTFEVDEILSRIMEVTTLVMEGDAGLLALLDKETGDLVISVPFGPLSAEIVNTRIPKGKGITGWVVEHETTLLVLDAQQDPRFYKLDEYANFEIHSMLCAPIKVQDEIIGVLSVINKNDGRKFDDSDIGLIEAIAHQAAIALETARLHKEELEKQRMEHELLFARKIQEGFWPAELPQIPGIQIAARSEPATQVGGDYYDFIQLTDGRLGIAIGDISGKDVSAALLMATTRMALRAQAEESGRSISDILFRLNNAIYRDTAPEKFLTLFYCVLEPQDKRFTYINGAHNPPILYNIHTQRLERLDVGGTLVGMFENTTFEKGQVQLTHGDLMVMYTDGVTEASNLNGELFEEERLFYLIDKYKDLDAQSLLEAIRHEVEEFSMGMPQQDDLTLMIMKVE